MVNDNHGNHPFDASRKTADGAGQAGDDAPMFVDSSEEYFNHMRKASKQAAFSYRWIGKYSTILWLFTFLYASAFVVAESSFPQLYRAWLDFCMPLAEFVGGLTPRADMITAELIAGGYPERVDDAVHGIAMARILTIPAIVCMLAGLIEAVNIPPSVVSCTRRTHKRIWLFVLFTFALIFIFGLMEFKGESFDARPFFKGYHDGNIAITWDMMLAYCIPFIIAVGFWRVLLVRATHFNIVKQQPDPKP